jgi:hypothetical protein
MAQAAARAGDARILTDHPVLRFAASGYKYLIRREGGQINYSVSGGGRTLTAPVLWAFGFGAMGQTYIYQYGGALYESQVSFYSALNGLDLTIGHTSSVPASVEEAAGRPIQKREAVRCFGCHTTGQLNAPEPGVQCEHCHKNAQMHARSLADRTVAEVTPEKLSRLSVEEQSEFCGGCHRTWQEVSANGPHDVNNVRFQPYRLATSRCYNSSVNDQRIACVACHNPHEKLVKTPESYDANCLACHDTRRVSAGIKICPVAARGCTTCHMPKVDFPHGHFQFTDHRIRVVRASAGYPD